MNYKLDGYIIRKFLGTFFATIALIVVIIIVFDISEKIGTFVEKNVPVKGIIFHYYLNFVPFLVNMFSFLFIFISVIFFTSRMAQNSEIIAILGSGINFKRLLVPYIVSAVIIGLFNLYLANFLIPNMTKDRLAFERAYMRQEYINSGSDIHLRYDDSTYYYVSSFHQANQSGSKFSYEIIKDRQLIEKFSANTVRFDSALNKWVTTDYVKRRLLPEGETVCTGSYLEIDLPIRPLDFAKDYIKVEEMSFKELNRFIAQERMRGSNQAKFFEYERWQRFMQPFAAVVLTLIGVSLSIHERRKGGMGRNLAIGITLAFTFILFMQFAKVFATVGNFPVWLAAWTPVIIYGLIGAYLLKKAPK